MAAVVASLAAFLAGFELPALPTVGLSSQRVGSRPRGRADENEWHAESSTTDLAKATSGARYEKTTIQQRRLPRNRSPKHPRGVTHQRNIVAIESNAIVADRKSVATTAVWPADFAIGALPPSDHRVQCPIRRSERSQDRDAPPRVHFDLSLNSVHEVTPYSEVYGLHPRKFYFAREQSVPDSPEGEPCTIIPVCKWTGVCIEEDSSDSDEECQDDAELGMIRKARHRIFLKHLRLPWPVWIAFCASVVVLRVIGVDLSLEFAEKSH
eukprot:TRINITY_DN63101_c0_g1_i1.p1 TRINITY_DN63101_c0_g1~~TRINITY_DN63101_c0_g1_i1.p1  ORF type:complete len:267 (-),score=29.59 TRINITY_DN63101_c0_g1_i1:218-1018(-)